MPAIENYEDKTTKLNQSVEKVFSIIELLSKNRDPMRLQDMSKELKINASTLVRFLATLMKCGYVSQEKDSSRYFLTFKICSLAARVSSQLRLREVANPYLKDLSAHCGESVCLAIEQDMSVVYVDVIEGKDQMLRTMNRIGNVAPMHCTGVGKLMLLNYDDAKLNQLIAERGLQKFTENTITTKKDLVAELNTIRRQGYAYDNEECEIGAKCISFPIRDYTGNVIAAISVTGPIFRMTQEYIDSQIPYIRNTALEISKRVGYDL